MFHPIELLPAAWSTLGFPWEPERDDEREQGLADGGRGRSATQSAGSRTGPISSSSMRTTSVSATLVVSSPRGELRFSALLDSQLEHVSFHHAQLVEFLSTLSP